MKKHELEEFAVVAADVDDHPDTEKAKKAFISKPTQAKALAYHEATLRAAELGGLERIENDASEVEIP